MLAVIAALLALSLLGYVFGASLTPQNSIIGSVTTSVQGGVTKFTNWIADTYTKMAKSEELMLENTELKDKIAELTEQLVDYQTVLKENKFYKDYLDIKDQNPDYVMEPANLISRNAEDPYGSFIINKGSLSGVSERDPVITNMGLVGYISEVNPTYSKVTTIMDANIKIGGIDKRTDDIGIVSGELALAEKGKTKMVNILRSSGVASGDYIVTAGGGVFPEGLIIGTVDSIHNAKVDTSLYAIITPVVDFKELRDVMVITYFPDKAGQDSLF
jgi:rod shape-determining protein MreC